MANALDFYFEFSSPYGYFAATQVEDLAHEAGLAINWHPILLGPIFKVSGSAPLTEIPVKGAYALRDFARTAHLFDIPFSQPDQFPIGTVAAARAAIWARQHHPDRLPTLIKALYKGYFADGRNIGDADTVLDIAAGQGLDRQKAAAGIADEDVKNRLKEEVAQAMERGVFGSPFIIIDGEPFWGFDRFPHIRRWLQARQAA
ncbi:2-hydroxychromene-2-carboxylate isomerase [Allopusillimonas soli]|uniref:2-hydroxychromene-2-carboxylate isomerase n=1 Tax=Allopusillimonas soli TaxID=659016 RepID=A0A853F523_9BURK|nr:2-hydroxychromene-2-carboxylate isomerase [Allopusillimonas soli]NYT35604.1 2-hydroxychromene-2-carboxylate isomerase [Allopusillimonas soli]TEA76006.1 2-hydroxychromene-2-carboxylate isomerase [Allopusillimonas soli]